MARRNRQTLKESFNHGKKPTEQDFGDLIDSTMNILDDGFSKNPEMGIGLAPLLDKGTVMSIFKESSDVTPQWDIAINQERSLEIRRCEDPNNIPVLTLKTDGSIEIGEKGKAIIFNGGVQAPVREGNLFQGEVPADGHWYDITDSLGGCCALEVVATVGKRHTGKHAILVATATTCFGNHSKIKKTNSYFGMYGHKICLKWKKIKGEYKAKLQLKTIFKYGEDIQIQYHITSLLMPDFS
jgi:hypothetical protein